MNEHTKKDIMGFHPDKKKRRDTQQAKEPHEADTKMKNKYFMWFVVVITAIISAFLCYWFYSGIAERYWPMNVLNCQLHISKITGKLVNMC